MHASDYPLTANLRHRRPVLPELAALVPKPRVNLTRFQVSLRPIANTAR
jgi:hypothetical protein